MTRRLSGALATIGFVLVVLIAIQGVILSAMGQPLICACGTVRLWQGDLFGPENSQQILDWYSFSHVIHGMIYFGLLRLLAPTLPLPAAFAIAIGLEITWELVENSPQVIERYRQQALAQGYAGDSVLNSISDTLMAALGFFIARALAWKPAVGLAVAMEMFTLIMVRDNLTLNIIQLVHPIPAIAAWQVEPRS